MSFRFSAFGLGLYGFPQIRPRQVSAPTAARCGAWVRAANSSQVTTERSNGPPNGNKFGRSKERRIFGDPTCKIGRCTHSAMCRRAGRPSAQRPVDRVDRPAGPVAQPSSDRPAGRPFPTAPSGDRPTVRPTARRRALFTGPVASRRSRARVRFDAMAAFYAPLLRGARPALAAVAAVAVERGRAERERRPWLRPAPRPSWRAPVRCDAAAGSAPRVRQGGGMGAQLGLGLSTVQHRRLGASQPNPASASCQGVPLTGSLRFVLGDWDATRATCCSAHSSLAQVFNVIVEIRLAMEPCRAPS